VKAFKRDYHFKFVWTKQGKVFLKKDDSSSSTARSFTSLEEFAAFKEASSRGNANLLLLMLPDKWFIYQFYFQHLY